MSSEDPFIQFILMTREKLKEIQKEKEIKGPLLWKPVRVALTGVVSGPDLPLVIDVYGKEKVLSTLNHVITNYTN